MSNITDRIKELINTKLHNIKIERNYIHVHNILRHFDR